MRPRSYVFEPIQQNIYFYILRSNYFVYSFSSEHRKYFGFSCSQNYMTVYIEHDFCKKCILCRYLTKMSGIPCQTKFNLSV